MNWKEEQVEVETSSNVYAFEHYMGASLHEYFTFFLMQTNLLNSTFEA